MIDIDQSVYPDVDEPPRTLETIEAKADYVHRICAAWDFHVHPEPATFQLFAQWKEVFDCFPLLTSPAYHAFRAWFGWEKVTCPEGLAPPVPYYVHLDYWEGRDEDPCATCI